MMSTKNKHILISGASIAGPTLAYWLNRYGFTPTVIERAPHLREGGYPVDVRFEGQPSLLSCLLSNGIIVERQIRAIALPP
jgi:2-polyprenyl-6-methoxyphenol hydroxylase-like FAD-dependent oxidoreductase